MLCYPRRPTIVKNYSQESTHLFIFIYLSICLSIDRSVGRSVGLSVGLSVYLFIYWLIDLLIYLFDLFIYLSILFADLVFLEFRKKVESAPKCLILDALKIKLTTLQISLEGNTAIFFSGH